MPPALLLALGTVVVALSVVAIVRRADVRLVLVLAGLTLGILAGDPAPIVRKFLITLSNEQFVVPICSAMGFAYVMRRNGCDQHLVRLLVRPIRHVRTLLIPGAVVVGFVVNIPVISQTSTAVAIGAVLVPLLRAGGISPVTTGSALLLGASLGGELLNPGAPELRTVATALKIDAGDCVQNLLPLVLTQLVVATAVFWFVSSRAERNYTPPAEESDVSTEVDGRINLFKASVPLLPLVLLFLCTGPLQVFTVPEDWVVVPGAASGGSYNSRLIGLAMLIGVVVAALTDIREAGGTAAAFFEGAGYAFTHIIGIIVAASCFGAGIEKVGLAAVIATLIQQLPHLLLPVAAALPLGFGVVSGSGMAATQSLFGFFVEPSRQQGVDPSQVGAVVSVGAAAGRTMSPVAAVTLMSASLTGTSPFELCRRVAVPLLLGMVAVVVVAMLLARG